MLALISWCLWTMKMLVLVINRSLSFVLEYPYGSVCAITVPLTFKGRRSIKGQEVYPNYLSQFFSLSSLDIWQWQWQRAPCMGGNLRIWKDTSKLSAARCCPMEGHQLLNATFFDPCLNLCLDQAGIKNTISQTSYLSFFLQVKVKEKGKSTCLSAGVDAEPKSTPLLSLLFPYWFSSFFKLIARVISWYWKYDAGKTQEYISHERNYFDLTIVQNWVLLSMLQLCEYVRFVLVYQLPWPFSIHLFRIGGLGNPSVFF